jgi:hypothetical protein
MNTDKLTKLVEEWESMMVGLDSDHRKFIADDGDSAMRDLKLQYLQNLKSWAKIVKDAIK